MTGLFRRLQRWSMVTLLAGGTLGLAGCGTRDMWNAVIKGALGFIEQTAEDSLSAISPLPDLLDG